MGGGGMNDWGQQIAGEISAAYKYKKKPTRLVLSYSVAREVWKDCMQPNPGHTWEEQEQWVREHPPPPHNNPRKKWGTVFGIPTYVTPDIDLRVRDK